MLHFAKCCPVKETEGGQDFPQARPVTDDLMLVGKLSLPDAISTFTSDYFCRYIEGTDYGLAFQNAYLFLRESVMKKKVILMSDGLPDTRAQNKREGKDPDPDNKIARQKGLASAEKIMALSQAEILVLFFNESLQGEIPIESMNYLTKITKKPSNVLSVFDSSFQNKLNQILSQFLRQIQLIHDFETMLS